MGIFINGTEYKGSSSAVLSLDTEVQTHPVETGFDIADHVKHINPMFMLTLTLGGGDTDRDTEYLALKTLRDNSTLFTFLSELGSFDDMVMSKLTPAIEASENTYSCDLTVIQVRQAELVTQDIPVSDIYAPTVPAGTPPTESLQWETVDDEPTKTEESWLKSISNWIGGLF